MKSVVVTGVSTGIGWGCVKVLIESGFRVFGSVRKQSDAERLANEFGPNFTPLIFDVTDKAAVAEGARQVEAALGGETLLGLVNNAGVAVVGPLIGLRIEEFEHQLAVNLTGPLIVTQAFKGLLGVDRPRRGAPGRIVMISSVGGKNAMPFLGPYCASKFGLEGMSESLRRELMIFGVDVIVVAPGTIATPIWNKADAVDVTPFANGPYAPALAETQGLHDLQRQRRPASGANRRNGEDRADRQETEDPLHRDPQSAAEPAGAHSAQTPHRWSHRAAPRASRISSRWRRAASRTSPTSPD